MKNTFYELNFNFFKYFYILAQLKSYTKTSQYFYVSQPNISYAIKQLEKYFSQPLFTKNNKELELTSFGKELYHSVSNMFDNIQICNNIKPEIKKQSLTIGIQSHVYTLLKNTINNFINLNSNYEVVFNEDSTETLIENLSKNKIDIVIDVAPIPNLPKNCTIKKISEEKLCFAASTKFAASKKITDIKDLQNYDLLMPSPKSSIRKNLDKCLNEKNFSLKPKYQSNSTSVSIDLIQNCNLIGYVFENSIKEQTQKNSLMKLNITNLSTYIPLCYIIKKDNNNPILHKFITILEEDIVKC